MSESEMILNGCEIFSTNRGYLAKDLLDNCVILYNVNFNEVKGKVSVIKHPLKSMYWDAGKYDKFGKQLHSKVMLL